VYASRDSGAMKQPWVLLHRTAQAETKKAAASNQQHGLVGPSATQSDVGSVGEPVGPPHVLIVLSFSVSCAFPQQRWPAAAGKLPALSPISSQPASKYRANGKSCFDAATCTRTATGTDGQLTVTVINPSQHRCSRGAPLPCVAHDDEALREAILKPGEDVCIFSSRVRFVSHLLIFQAVAPPPGLIR